MTHNINAQFDANIMITIFLCAQRGALRGARRNSAPRGAVVISVECNNRCYITTVVILTTNRTSGAPCTRAGILELVLEDEVNGVKENVQEWEEVEGEYMIAAVAPS